MFFPDADDVIAWRVADNGCQIVLSAEVPDLVHKNLRQGVHSFLSDQRLSRHDINHWIAHNCGPKVLQPMEGALELPRCAVARLWKSLAAVGNLSSASVLFVAAGLSWIHELRTRVTRSSALDGSWILRRTGFAVVRRLYRGHWFVTNGLLMIARGEQ
jgi:alkylresorcinol/alkylpyrone synthase